MKNLILPFHILYSIYTYTMYFILMVPVILIFFPVGLIPRNRRMIIVFYINTIWFSTWGLLTGIFMRSKGLEKIERGKDYVMISNHVNMMDMNMIGSMIKHPFQPLIKKELLSIPLFGMLFRKTAVAVDRSSPESRRASFNTMSSRLDEGTSVVFFPEGTRNTTKAPLGPFYAGAFRLAVANEVPIVPLLLIDVRKVQKPGSWLIQPGIVEMHVGDPIPTKGLTAEDVPDLMKRIHQLYWDYLIEYDEVFKDFEGKKVAALTGK